MRKVYLIVLLLVTASMVLRIDYANAKRRGSAMARVWAQTSAWDTTCQPYTDADYDHREQPFWAEVSVSSSAGNGHGRAKAKAWIKMFSAGISGDHSGTHSGSEGQWKAGYCPQGASDGLPFRILAGSITIRVRTQATANLTMTISDETTGLYAFNGSIFLIGGSSPIFQGDFLGQWFSIDIGIGYTSVSLVTPIIVTIAEGHDYTYSGEAGGSGILGGNGDSYVNFEMSTPDGDSGGGVGGSIFEVDKLGLLAPYLGACFTFVSVIALALTYTRRFKNSRRREKTNNP